MTCRIEAVANREVIRHRHPREHHLDVPARIEPRSKRIASEYVERLKPPCCACRLHGIAIQIDCRAAGKNIAVLDSREIPEDALPRLRRQNRSRNVCAFDAPLPFVKEKEKRFVSDDRSTQPPAKLVPVQIIFACTIQVVPPIVGVERLIAVVPKEAAAEIV